jgi:hypothetical protein
MRLPKFLLMKLLKPTLALILLSLANPCRAELLPALQVMANKQKQAVKTIFDERVDAVMKVQDVYLAELKAAELKAAESGVADAIKAIDLEKKGLEQGNLPPNPPAGLPKNLHNGRKTYQRNFERVDATFNKRKSELDSAYLVQLAKMQRDNASDATWQTQLASEKTRVLAGAWGPITDMRIGIAGTKWLNNNNGTGTRAFLTNGTVTESNGSSGWKYETPDAQTVVIHWSDSNHLTMHLQKDGKTLTDYNGSWTLLPKGAE